MKEKCLIISLKYHAGHWSHVVATYSLFSDLGYDPYLLVNKHFLLNKDGFKFRIINSLSFWDYKCYKIVVVLFPDVRNTWELCKFRFFGRAKIIYLFHEPIGNYLSFYNSGFTQMQLVKLFFVNQFNKFTSFISTIVLLPSNTSFLIYSHYYKYLNSNFFLVPLLFEDEVESSHLITTNKKFISYIGTVASDHAFDKFYNFIKYAIKNYLFQDYIFLIATSNILSPEVRNDLLTLREQVNLEIIDGNWLSNEEINYYFNCSAVVWNAYDRSTQSGVLPKSFMFGTPVLGNKLVSNEFIIQYFNGIYLHDNSDFNEISRALFDILNKLDYYSENSRQTFLAKYYYKNYISIFNKLLRFNSFL